MPPNAPATAILGLGAGLQPEEATNFSLALAFHPEGALSLTFDLYQVEVRNRIAATSTFYGTIDGQLYSQVIVDAIIANGNVLDPEVTASGDTGINLFTNGVTTRTRGADLMFNYSTVFSWADVDWSIAATYNETEVTKVRATPPEFGTTQPLFDLEALSDLEDTMPNYLVNLGAVFRWERVTFSIHEMVYGPCSDYDNDGGQTNGEIMFYKNEIGMTPITNLEASFIAMEGLSFVIGATNVFDEYPATSATTPTARSSSTRVTTASWRATRAFSPFGINGAYYYGKLTYSFRAR